MDKGMKHVGTLRNGTAVYFPGGGAAEVMESPEDCARVLNEYFI